MIKDRVFADNVQNINVDFETSPPIPISKEPVEKQVLSKLKEGNQESLMLSYFCERFLEVHSFEYKTDELKERSILRNLYHRYGADAQLMIEYFFDHYKGKWRERTENITMFSIKWITDSLYADVQTIKRKKHQSHTAPKGFLSSESFLSQFPVQGSKHSVPQ